MNTTTPAPSTLGARVCLHFTQHPDDEMDAVDIADKFAVKSRDVDALLTSEVAAGRLNRVVRNRLAVYLRGPMLLRPAAATTSLRGTTAAAAAAAKVKRKLVKLPEIDVAAIAVDAKLPLPARTAGRRAPQWSVLLDRLVKPGQHSAPIPIEFKSSLKGAASKRAKDSGGGRYAVHAVSETHVRIWRTE
jgi:hypothetical protein